MEGERSRMEEVSSQRQYPRVIRKDDKRQEAHKKVKHTRPCDPSMKRKVKLRGMNSAARDPATYNWACNFFDNGATPDSNK